MSDNDDGRRLPERVFEVIERLPRREDVDPIPPRALLDLPETAAAPGRTAAAVVLMLLLALAGIAELRQRFAPAPAHAAPPSERPEDR